MNGIEAFIEVLDHSKTIDEIVPVATKSGFFKGLTLTINKNTTDEDMSNFSKGLSNLLHGQQKEPLVAIN